MRVLAIDPGNVDSAFVVLTDKYEIFEHGKMENNTLLEYLPRLIVAHGVTDVAIEMVASYGMAVGKTVFDTCVWIGRFWQMCDTGTPSPYIAEKALIYRMEEKMNLCHVANAKDSNIRQALIDRFAPDTPNGGKGTKKNPGYFYGFAADEWAAMAVGVTYLDKMKGETT